jgi:CheY-like chemotaxis protein
MSPDLSESVARGDHALALGRAAVASGMRSLTQSALLHVEAGRTTLHEVQRVLGDAPEAEGSGPEREAAPEAPAVAPITGVVDAPRLGLVKTPADAKAHSSASTPGVDQPGTQTGRVLVVDDDPVHRAVAKRLLEAQGFCVEEATNGGEALQRVASSAAFDLVLTDLSMPGMGGRDVVSCLRAMPRTARTPIIVATSEENGDAEVELMEAGADDYIRKPIDPTRFVARIRAALRRAVLATPRAA